MRKSLGNPKQSSFTVQDYPVKDRGSHSGAGIKGLCFSNLVGVRLFPPPLPAMTLFTCITSSLAGDRHGTKDTCPCLTDSCFSLFLCIGLDTTAFVLDRNLLAKCCVCNCCFFSLTINHSSSEFNKINSLNRICEIICYSKLMTNIGCEKAQCFTFYCSLQFSAMDRIFPQ